MITARDFGKAFLWKANQEGITVGNLQLQKLAYYCQGYFIALHGEKLFDEKINVYNLGPVVTSLYREYKGVKEISLDKFKEGSSIFKSLDERIKSTIDYVLNLVGHLSAWDLVLKTHQESPWMNHSLGINKADGCEITTEEMKVFFKSELSKLQDLHLVGVINALEASEKSGAIEIPESVLDNDDDFIAWAKNL